MRLTPERISLLQRWRSDKVAFAAEVLKVRNEKAKIVPLVPNENQVELNEAISGRLKTYVLKSRKIGASTWVAADFFHEALFVPGTEVMVVAHSEDAVKTNISPIYHRFYNYMPEWLKEMVPLRKQNDHLLEFDPKHGSRISFRTSGTEGFRGGTPNCLHCSEFAFWPDPVTTIASLFSSAPDDARVILETTANGLNYAYGLWNDEDPVWEKVFLPWTEDRRCVAKFAAKKYEEVVQAASDYDLTPQQLNWWNNVYKTKAAGNLRKLFQEFPITPSMAFVSTGGRYFHSVFSVSGEPKEGYIRYSEPEKYRVYIMGIDTAGGNEGGDYSAFVVLDATDMTKMRTVASYYGRVSERPFAKMVVKEVQLWRALAVPERNTTGVVVVEELRDALWPYIYHDLDKTDDENVWTRKYGLQTTVKSRPLMLSKLREAVFESWIDCRDQRFQIEANAFAFNGAGRPEAMPGHHDDMVMAHALAVYGASQRQMVADDVMSVRPRGGREIIEYEKKSGKLFRPEDFDDSASSAWGDRGFGVESLLAG